jgi:hypothetical protein
MRENGARVERERDSSSRAGDREGRLIDGGYMLRETDDYVELEYRAIRY